MPDNVVISVDLGTTGCRATAYDEHGARLGSHYLEYGLTHPETGAAEQEAEGWWSATRECVKRVAETLAGQHQVAGIGVSAQGHSWVPVNEELRPLRPALTWLDTRAAGVARELLRARGSQFWGHRAGKAPGPWHLLPQLLWLREREPSLDRNAAYYLFAHDFLIARMTGRPATDYTTAAGSLLFNIRDFEWDKALALEYGVDVRRFAPCMPAGTVAGGLCTEAAEAMGLAGGLPVVVGAQDQKCAAFAAGLEEGVATLSLGTSSAVTAHTRRPLFDEATAIPCFPYLWKGAWVLEAPLVTTGATLRWLRAVARGLGAQTVDYPDLMRLAEQSPVGARGVRCFPFLAGAGAPHWQEDAKGAFMGIGLDAQAGDLARAVLEGVAFEVRTNLESMQRQGLEIRRLRVFGGGAQSDLWMNIIASVTGLPVERTRDVERAAAGAAGLAMVAVGICGTLSEAQKRLRHDPSWFDPDPGSNYQSHYLQYCLERDAVLRPPQRRSIG